MQKPSPAARIGGAAADFRAFSGQVKAGILHPKAGSIAESDQQLSGNQLIPHGIVSGLTNAAADHLGAWTQLVSSDGKDKLLLHVNADFTLFRPVIEALTEIIWILDGSTADIRITRAMEVAMIEYQHGVTLSEALAKAGTPDVKINEGIVKLGEIIRTTATRIRLIGDDFLKRRVVDPSTLTKKIATHVPGSTMQTFRYWAITSAHAHAQLVTTLQFAVSTRVEAPSGGTLIEPDESLIAELVEFIGILIAIAVKMLKEQGYELSMA